MAVAAARVARRGRAGVSESPAAWEQVRRREARSRYRARGGSWSGGVGGGGGGGGGAWSSVHGGFEGEGLNPREGTP